jgi:hypothetical protein
MSRNITKCLIMAVTLLPLCVSAQKQVALKFNMTSPIARTFNVAGEWAFTQRFSGQVVYFKTSDFSFTTNNIEHVISGWGFTPEVRVHAFPQRLKGFYLGPYLRFRYLNWEIPSKDASATINSISGGFTVGYEAVIKNILIFDFYLGPSFGSHAIKVSQGVIEDFKLTSITTPVGIRSGIAIGVAIF